MNKKAFIKTALTVLVFVLVVIIRLLIYAGQKRHWQGLWP